MSWPKLHDPTDWYAKWLSCLVQWLSSLVPVHLLMMTLDTFVIVILLTDLLPHIKLIYLALFSLLKLYSRYPLLSSFWSSCVLCFVVRQIHHYLLDAKCCIFNLRQFFLHPLSLDQYIWQYIHFDQSAGSSHGHSPVKYWMGEEFWLSSEAWVVDSSVVGKVTCYFLLQKKQIKCVHFVSVLHEKKSCWLFEYLICLFLICEETFKY